MLSFAADEENGKGDQGATQENENEFHELAQHHGTKPNVGGHRQPTLAAKQQPAAVSASADRLGFIP